MAIDEVVRRNITPMDIDIPVLLLLVKRTNLVPETIAQLAKQNTSDLKKPLKVSNSHLSTSIGMHKLCTDRGWSMEGKGLNLYRDHPTFETLGVLDPGGLVHANTISTSIEASSDIAVNAQKLFVILIPSLESDHILPGTHLCSSVNWCKVNEIAKVTAGELNDEGIVHFIKPTSSK